ncbi:hypothetical protein LguiB_020957 [Lonicera macranthoides]
MATKEVIFLLALFALIFVHVSYGQEDPIDDPPDNDPIEDPAPTAPKPPTRDDFPKDFIFGTTSSAYQFEGAARDHGKGDSIWDVFTANHSDKVKDGSNGDIAEDFYHRYPEDLPIMQYLGFNAFRFSISWPRILPSEIIYNFYTPYLVQMMDDFREYAELCFSLFGDRVKKWITINEPWSYSTLGYAQGIFPPNRCSKGANKGLNRQFTFRPGRFASYADNVECPNGGNSGTEPYNVSHNLLLSHAAAVKVYREKYQKIQNGQIGISLCTQWYKPRNKTYYKDQWAKDRAIAWMYGWYMAPLTFGRYPRTMVKRVGDRLPKFNKEQKAMVKGSADFIGLNYYTASYVAHTACIEDNTYMNDPCAFVSNVSATGEAIGNKTYLDWLYVYPNGINDILRYGQRMYNNPPIYITENGVDRQNQGLDPNDLLRKEYHENHLAFIPKVIEQGVNVKGYFVWSYMDNFEWLDGYTVNFGLIYVDHQNNTLNRACKDSAKWFKNFLGSKQPLDFNTTYVNCDMN